MQLAEQWTGPVMTDGKNSQAVPRPVVWVFSSGHFMARGWAIRPAGRSSTLSVEEISLQHHTVPCLFVCLFVCLLLVDWRRCMCSFSTTTFTICCRWKTCGRSVSGRHRWTWVVCRPAVSTGLNVIKLTEWLIQYCYSLHCVAHSRAVMSLSVCPLAYLKNHTAKLHQILSACGRCWVLCWHVIYFLLQVLWMLWMFFRNGPYGASLYSH